MSLPRQPEAALPTALPTVLTWPVSSIHADSGAQVPPHRGPQARAAGVPPLQAPAQGEPRGLRQARGRRDVRAGAVVQDVGGPHQEVARFRPA